MNVIARRTGFVTGAAALTGYYAVEAHACITAGSTNAAQLVDAVVTWIIGRGY